MIEEIEKTEPNENKRAKQYEEEIVVSSNTVYDNMTKKYGDLMLQNVDIFIKFVYEWINRNVQSLGSKNLGERISFFPSDVNALFEMFGIDQAYVKACINKSQYIDKKWRISVEKINVLMYVLIFYYFDHRSLFEKSAKFKGVEPYKIANFLLSGRFFSSIIIRQFPFVPDQAIMFYTLENLSQKYTITKMNSLYEMIQYMADSNMETWIKVGRTKSRSDEDLDGYMRKLNTRISSTLVNISKQFYKNHKDEKKITEESNTMVTDEGKVVMTNANNISNIVSSSTSKIIENLYLDADINSKFVRIAANKTGAPYSSLYSAIQEIQRARDPDIETVIRNVLSYFLVSEKQSPMLINSAQFFEISIKAYRVANTNNEYILNIKKALNDLLEKYSAIYAQSHRKSTRTNFRAGLYLYLILYITKLN